MQQLTNQRTTFVKLRSQLAISPQRVTPHSSAQRLLIPCHARRGAVLVVAVLLILMAMAVAAIVVDLGYIRVARAQLCSASDAAALAGAARLAETNDPTLARAEALVYAALNNVAGQPVHLDPLNDIIFGREIYDAQTQRWSFQAGGTPYDSVKVIARRTAASTSLGASPDGPIQLFFGRILGTDAASSYGQAVARVVPRELALVVDLSASMNYDSTFYHQWKKGITPNNKDIWIAMGSPTYGLMNNWDTLQTLTGANSLIINTLGLNLVPWPYPGSGSWDQYVTFVKTTPHLAALGLQDQYGLQTWVEYILLVNYRKADCPILYQTPEQPITALKSAVGIMTDYLKANNTQDKLAYDSFDDVGREESPLVSNSQFDSIKNLVSAKQAGHWNPNTNIGDGIRAGWQSLTSGSASPNAFKVMIVFTDGKANRPAPSSTAIQYALNQATLAAQQGIVIHTIAFGYLADTTTMQQIATIGSGKFYYVVGNDANQYSQDLINVLLDIAKNPPLALAQ